MRTFRLTRTRGRLTAICESCGATSGPRSSEMPVLIWQRDHRCTTERKP